MEDIQLIEQGIHVLEFAEKYAKRNPDMEFRVKTQKKIKHDEGYYGF